MPDIGQPHEVMEIADDGHAAEVKEVLAHAAQAIARGVAAHGVAD